MRWISTTHQRQEGEGTADFFGQAAALMRQEWDSRARADLINLSFAWGNAQTAFSGFFNAGSTEGERLIREGISKIRFSPATKRILDIGSGPGRLFGGFALAGFDEIWGVDVSPEMVAWGQRACPQKEGVRFLIGNGTDLSCIESESVDYCFSYNVLPHLPDQRIVWSYLQEAFRVLRPGGAAQLHLRTARSGRRHLVRRLKSMARLVLSPPLALIRQGSRARQAVSRRVGKETAYGSYLPRATVLRQMKRMGFRPVEAYGDRDGPIDGTRFWVIATKPSVDSAS